MNNYFIMGIIFILVLGMLQLISINIRLRLDIKNDNIEIEILEKELEKLDIIHNRVCERYEELKSKYNGLLRNN